MLSLWHRSTSTLLPAQIIRPLTLADLEGVAGVWSNFRRQSGTLTQRQPQHAEWHWPGKLLEDAARTMDFLGLLCGGEIQGLMAVNLSPLRSRIQNKPQERVPYIEYVEAAPWNLAYYSSQPRFRGVGTMLLAAAIQQSLDAGHSGAIALHSLPQAEEFYRRCGFADLGLDSEEENLRYFEMSTGQAARFLKEALNG